MWAWKEKRVETMKAVLDQTLSIFPFEQDWFDSRGLQTDYVGHPFAEQEHLDESSKDFYQRHDITIEHPLLVLLPGSRQQEVDRHWPIFLQTVKKLKEANSLIQVMVGKAPNVSLSPMPNEFKIEENARKAMVAGTVAIVSSGTATLECAVEDTAMVVCYKLSTISWWMANNMASVKYASMVNLIADENIVPEFLQHNMTEENLVKSVIPLLNSKSIERKIMLSGFDKVRRTLGMPGVYDRAAELIISKTIVEA